MNFFYQSLAAAAGLSHVSAGMKINLKVDLLLVSLKPEEGEGIWGLALDAKIDCDEHGGSQNSYFFI